MNDRGDKIVMLARAMLRSDYIEHPHSLPQETTTPIKAIFLTAFLAAAGSTGLTTYIDNLHRPINRYEKVELEALAAYAAHQNDKPQEKIKADVLATLVLPSFDDMTSQDYLRARDYLRSKIR